MEKLNNKMITILIVSVLVCGSVYYVKSNNKEDTIILEQTQSIESETNAVETITEEILDYKVYVCGSVNNPKVVTIKKGSRVAEAVELAGGVNDEADINSVNFAAFIEDGQKIYIPKEGETVDKIEFTEQNNSIETNSPININKADKSQLQLLPGIGETIAQYIIDYRMQNGNFKSIEEIKNVSKIGDKTFEKIKDRISVEN